MAGGADVARYRVVEPRLWTDASFRSLSRARPNGQTLWLYLLTGPRTTALPGLVVARQAVVADDLGWTVEELRGVLTEPGLVSQLEADWEVGVVVLAYAFFTPDGAVNEASRPPGKNNVIGWLKGLEEVPACPLKSVYIKRLESFSKALGPPFSEPFNQASPTPSPTPSPIQDQDQEQKQDKDLPTPSGAGFALSPSGSPETRRQKPKPKADRAAAVAPEAWEAADELRRLILRKQPTNALSREPWDAQKQTGKRLSWALEFQKLLSVDKRPAGEVIPVLRWLFEQQDMFVVQSPAALRAKWDRIAIGIERDQRDNGNNVIEFSEARRKALAAQIDASCDRQLQKTHTRQPPPVQPFSFTADDE